MNNTHAKTYEIKWISAVATYDLIIDGEWYAESTSYRKLERIAKRMNLTETEYGY